MTRIDLHTHSIASDGTETPAEVMRQAQRAGLDVVALTDHDTVSGLDEAARVADELGLEFVPGVEFSASIGPASVHMLGYYVDATSDELLATMQQTRRDRESRAERMVARIAADYPLTWDDVLAVAEPGATLGRPHIADALVARGIVADRSEAFASILHWRGGYYQPQEAPSPEDAVRIIRRAGGVPIVAHPASRGSRVMEPGRLDALIHAGLAGIEVDHRENSHEARAMLRAIAERHSLIVTGSSDYHGAGKPNQLGEHTTALTELMKIQDLAGRA